MSFSNVCQGDISAGSQLLRAMRVLESAHRWHTRNGWLLVARPHDPKKLAAQFSVLRTNDGGATWRASSLAHYTDCFDCVDRGWGSILDGRIDALMFLNQREG